MAEFVFKRMVEENNLSSSFRISSFATSEEEDGQPIYPPAKRTLLAHGINAEHRSTPLKLSDVINNDYILVMDSGNLFDVLRLTSGEFGEKIFKLCSFTSNPRDVADPWYTLDFEKAYSDIEDGCRAFLNYLTQKYGNLFEYNKRF
jgi:protein-tyrosine phosphatase